MTIAPHTLFADMPEAFLDALAVECTVTIGGVPLADPVKVIARGPHGEIVPNSGYGEEGVTGQRPRASFAASAVPGLKDGDTMVLGGVTWTIREPLPDGRGMVRCELEKAV